MRIKRFLLKFLFFSFAIYLFIGLLLSQYQLRIFPETLTEPESSKYYDYSGVMNVHSMKSTGRGSIDEIIREAQEAALDFVIVTDLNLFSNKLAKDFYSDSLLLLFGAEYSYLDSRVLWLEETSKTLFPSPGQQQIVFSDLLNKSNPADQLMVLAHPTKKGFRWNGTIPPGIDGLEIINLKSLWQKAWRKSKASVIWSFFMYPFNPEYALLRLYEEPKEEIEMWNQMSRQRKTLAFTGTDADAKVKFPRNARFGASSYKSMFSISRIHILLESELTGDVASDRKKIFQALKKGQHYLSLDGLSDPTGFEIYGENSSGKTFTLGAEVKLDEETLLHFKLPAIPESPYDVVFLRNGEIYKSFKAPEDSFQVTEPGNYRMIVRVIPTLPLPDGKRWFTWIYTNSIRIQ